MAYNPGAYTKFKPSLPDKERQEEWLQEQLGDWAENTKRELITAIEKRNLKLTDELVRSIEYQVVKAAEDQASGVKLAFEDYGRMKEMRHLFYDKMPPVSVMEEFVRKVGLGKFKYVPGYLNKSKVPSEDVAIKRIAWGISKSRLTDTKHKPRKWFAKNFYSKINILIDRLLEGYQDISLDTIEKNITMVDGQIRRNSKHNNF
jgi:hypothetical protein